MIALATDNRPAIGTPVYAPNLYGDRRGYVAAVSEYTGGTRYTIGASGMQKEAPLDIRVVFDNVTETTVSAGIAAPWIQKAADMGMTPETPERVAEMLAEAVAAAAERRAENERARQKAAADLAAFRDKYRDKIPADAQAVIVAELEHDDSDVMTDYFSTRTSRKVILAFSTHRRDLFSEMRKAARNFAETAHLADAPAEAEHREKWSMGAGYYLKATGRYSDGWKVRKESFYLPHGVNDRAAALPFGEWAVPDAAEAQPKVERATKPDAGAKVETAAETVAGMIVSEHVHTKKGFAFYIVQAPERVTRDTFDSWLNRAKGLRGWYSRKWGDTPAGFAFKDRAAAVKFAEGCTNA